MASSSPKIAIELTPNEALIVFEYLRRSDDEGTYRFIDQAEQRVLWNLECLLERQVPVFDPHYSDVLKQAWAVIRDKEE